MDELKRLPPVTRVLLVTFVVVTLLVRMDVFKLSLLCLSFDALFRDFQLWRLLTNVFIHGLNVPFILNMLSLFKYGAHLERTHFNSTADYVWFLILGGAALNCAGLWLQWSNVGCSMVFMIITYWAWKNPSRQLEYWFGISFQAKFFPLALLALNMLLGSAALPMVIGILTALAYAFLKEQNPSNPLLKTPKFLKS